MSFKRLSLNLGFLLLLSVPAVAKQVSVEWKEIRGAAHYEIKLFKDGKVTTTEKLDEPKWKGEVGNGLYTYEICAVDRFGHLGAWSSARPLVVMPKAPEKESPRRGESLTLYNPQASTVLRWKSSAGATSYQVEVAESGRTIFSKQVKGTSVDVPALKPGSYNWKVSPIVEGRTPASDQAKSWTGNAGTESSFSVKKGTLSGIEPTSPEPEIVPPSDGKLRLRWKEVEGAEAYEVQVSPISSSKVTSVPQTIVVKENRANVDVPLKAEGQVTWKVRALANYNSSDVPGALGPQSIQSVTLNRNAGYFDGSGYISISTMIAPYQYQVVDPRSGFSGSTSSSQTTVRLSGEYWFAPQWAVAPAFETTQFSVFNQGFSRKTAELFLKYRTKLGENHSGWFFAPKVGLEARDYVELDPNIDQNGNISSGVNSTTYTAFGPSLGFDIRKQFTEKFSVGGKFDLFVPAKISGGQDGAASLASNGLFTNVSAGVQGLYWLNPSWGLGMGTYAELRSLSYQISENSGPNNNPDGSVKTNSVNFYGSLIYSFGR